MNEIAARYGDALFSLASDKNLVREYQSEVKELIRIFLKNSEFLELLSSGFVSLDEKKKIIDDTLIGVSDDILSLIKIAVGNGKAHDLLDILYSYNSDANEYLNIDEGFVYSTIPLKEDTLKQITEKISAQEGRPVELRNYIDPSLIGGVKVVVHDHVYDGSIKNKINDLRNNLLKKEGDNNEN